MIGNYQELKQINSKSHKNCTIRNSCNKKIPHTRSNIGLSALKANNSKTNSTIWPNFKLVRDLIHVFLQEKVFAKHFTPKVIVCTEKLLSKIIQRLISESTYHHQRNFKTLAYMLHQF